MSSRRFRRISLLAAFALFASSWSLSSPASAAATWHGGDCWRAGTPPWCYQMYYSVPVGQPFNFYVTDNVQQVYSNHTHSNMQIGIDNWTFYNGPINLYFTHHANEEAYKYIAESNETHGLTRNDGNYALTWTCWTNGTCTQFLNVGPPLGVNIDHANTFVQTDTTALGWVGTLDDSCAVRMYEHEAGHAQGSAHSIYTADLMWRTFGPTGCLDTLTGRDIGFSPPCTGQPTNSDSLPNAGLACVYNWNY